MGRHRAISLGCHNTTEACIRPVGVRPWIEAAKIKTTTAWEAFAPMSKISRGISKNTRDGDHAECPGFSKKKPTYGCCGLQIDQQSQNHHPPPWFLAVGNSSVHVSNWSLDGDTEKNRKPLNINDLQRFTSVLSSRRSRVQVSSVPHRE